LYESESRHNNDCEIVENSENDQQVVNISSNCVTNSSLICSKIDLKSIDA
jgi:hypothetical protein